MSGTEVFWLMFWLEVGGFVLLLAIIFNYFDKGR